MQSENFSSVSYRLFSHMILFFFKLSFSDETVKTAYKHRRNWWKTCFIQSDAWGQFLSKKVKVLRLLIGKKGTIRWFMPETSDTHFQPCHSWEWWNSRKIISESDEQQGACNESKGWGREKSPEGPHEGTPAEEDEELAIFTEKDSVWQIGPEQTHAEPEIPTYCSRRSINTAWSMVSRQRGPTEEELKSQAFCEDITSVWIYCGGWTEHVIGCSSNETEGLKQFVKNYMNIFKGQVVIKRRMSGVMLTRFLLAF